MRIVSSAVSMAATHEKATVVSRQERLVVWVGERPGAVASPPPAPAASPSSGGDADAAAAAPPDRDLLLLVKMFSRTADEARSALRAAADIRRAYATAPPVEAAAVPASTAAPAAVGWGVEYDLHETRAEVERTTFAATGAVETADGRRVTFDSRLEMARAEVEVRDVSVRAGDAVKKDPLVMSLDGGPARFSGTHQIDLDADGQAETVARLAEGSAYLVRDRDGDGAVDDGRELYGPRSGDGFGELAAEDADGNGWIDEGDPVWAELRLWTPTESEALRTLAEGNVGAIHVGSVLTPFDVRSGGGTQASVARTGIYLKEDGSGASAVQHVDLVV